MFKIPRFKIFPTMFRHRLQSSRSSSRPSAPDELSSSHSAGENSPERPLEEAARLRRAKACWEQSLADLNEARTLLRGKHWLQSGFLSLQAAMNAMTCVVTLHGEFQFPAHSPGQMAATCAGLEKALSPLIEPGQALEAVQALNPFAPSAPSDTERANARESFENGKKIVKVVRAFLKKNRRQYFKP